MNDTAANDSSAEVMTSSQEVEKRIKRFFFFGYCHEQNGILSVTEKQMINFL